MLRHTGAQSLNLSGTPVEPRRSSRVTRAPDRLVNHTEEPSSSRATPSKQKSKDENPRYAVLLRRLAKTLKENPQAIEEDEEEKYPFWCTCKMGNLGGQSVRCDVPTCNIVWWHMECLPERHQTRAQQDDGKLSNELPAYPVAEAKAELWICPN